MIGFLKFNLSLVHCLSVQIGQLSPAEQRVATLLGVSESYVAKKAAGQATRKVPSPFS